MNENKAPIASEIHSWAVVPENSTVLGYNNSVDFWPCLRFDEAIPRNKSSLMLVIAGKDAPIDIHLSVPFAHPEDSLMKSEDLGWYRVRPNFEGVADVVMHDGKWTWQSR